MLSCSQIISFIFYLDFKLIKCETNKKDCFIGHTNEIILLIMNDRGSGSSERRLKMRRNFRRINRSCRFALVSFQALQHTNIRFLHVFLWGRSIFVKGFFCLVFVKAIGAIIPRWAFIVPLEYQNWLILVARRIIQKMWIKQPFFRSNFRLFSILLPFKISLTRNFPKCNKNWNYMP